MRDLGALGRVVVDRDAAGRGSGSSVGLGKLWVLGAVNRLLEDGLGLVELELGLEVLEVVGIAGRIGSTAGVGEVELVVKDLITRVAPINDQRIDPKYCVTVCFPKGYRQVRKRNRAGIRPVDIAMVANRRLPWGPKQMLKGCRQRSQGRDLPIALSSTTLLDLLGVLANMTMLREVARQMLLGSSSAIG